MAKACLLDRGLIEFLLKWYFHMKDTLTSKACFKSGVASGSTVTVCSEPFDGAPFAPFPLWRPLAFSVFSPLSLMGVADAVGGGRAGIHGFMYPWAMALHIWHNRTVSLFERKINTNSVEWWDNKSWHGLITTPHWQKYAFAILMQNMYLIPKFPNKNCFKALRTLYALGTKFAAVRKDFCHYFFLSIHTGTLAATKFSSR